MNISTEHINFNVLDRKSMSDRLKVLGFRVYEELETDESLPEALPIVYELMSLATGSLATDVLKDSIAYWDYHLRFKRQHPQLDLMFAQCIDCVVTSNSGIEQIFSEMTFLNEKNAESSTNSNWLVIFDNILVEIYREAETALTDDNGVCRKQSYEYDAMIVQKLKEKGSELQEACASTETDSRHTIGKMRKRNTTFDSNRSVFKENMIKTKVQKPELEISAVDANTATNSLNAAFLERCNELNSGRRRGRSRLPYSDRSTPNLNRALQLLVIGG